MSFWQKFCYSAENFIKIMTFLYQCMAKSYIKWLKYIFCKYLILVSNISYYFTVSSFQFQADVIIYYITWLAKLWEISSCQLDVKKCMRIHMYSAIKLLPKYFLWYTGVLLKQSFFSKIITTEAHSARSTLCWVLSCWFYCCNTVKPLI